MESNAFSKSIVSKMPGVPVCSVYLYKEAQSLTCQHVTGHLTDQSRDQFEQVFAAHRKSTGLNKVKVVMIVYECGQKPFVEKD